MDTLLGEIGLERSDVYIANVLKCRPPGNRDPLEDEIAACEGHLFKQVELIRPQVICTLGNFATKLLTGRPHGVGLLFAARALQGLAVGLISGAAGAALLDLRRTAALRRSSPAQRQPAAGPSARSARARWRSTLRRRPTWSGGCCSGRSSPASSPYWRCQSLERCAPAS